MKGKKDNLEGQRFCRLIVVGAAPKRGERRFWLCRCDCGKLTEVSTANLRSGAVRSCGCLALEKAREVHTTHGGKYSRLYSIWVGLRRRCNDSRRKAFKEYGGRGIFVCKEWDENFVVFRDWALANGYSENLSIDRINNNDGYYPSNCRWANLNEQNNNRRNNHYVVINGEKKTITEWCRFYGNNTQMVLERIKRGWDEIKAIQTPQLRFLKYKRNNAKF